MTKKLIAFIFIFILMFVFACQSTSPQEKIVPTPAGNYIGLRNTWFNTTAEDLGLHVEPESMIPYAIVMDIGLDAATVSVASSIVGDGSLFSTAGGAVLGGIGYENVRAASINFVKVSADFVDKMEITTEFPLPSANNVKFYLITANGIYTTNEANPAILAGGKHELSQLFLAGNDVITELRKASEEK